MSLKSIKPIDDNKIIKDLPDGITGFINANNLHKTTNGFVWAHDVLNLGMTADIESTAHKTEWYFKLNKYTPDNVAFVGYISEQADSIINQNKDLPSTDIQVFPLPYGEYKHEREFDLNDKDLRITPRNIADSKISTGQWLVDVRKDISTLPTKNYPKDHKSEPIKALKVDDVVKVKEWYERPLGILFIAIAGTVLAAGVVYWLGWNK